uniref:Uncharacterized protein n=1 Tax=Burkholderia sp. Ha185 TaxID=1562173 RepID=A0A0R5RMS0_9BURK|nr:hypothetical protein [Burkholderia sp. Ha185]
MRECYGIRYRSPGDGASRATGLAIALCLIVKSLTKRRVRMTTVATKEELKSARENEAAQIVVVGELADKLKRTKKIATLSAVTLTAIVAVVGLAAVAAPETAGLSFVALGPLAGLSGIEIATIILAASIGLSLILAIHKEYDEIGYKEGELVLRRKSTK